MFNAKPNHWYKNTIFYELYIRAFADGDGDGHGDLRGLTGKLDYLQTLGVDCLWILPMYASPQVDDGYDISDYYSVHPDYGTLEDFKVFLDEAHARGMRVITDLVMNHTSDQHPWFQEARASQDSPKRDYYVWSPTDEKYQEVRIIFLDSQTSNWAYDPHTAEYYFHRFYPQQPDLNYDNPEVQQAMLDIMDFWLNMGVDGFRCDAVPYLYESEGTNCENLPETHDYLKRVRRWLDERYPDRILLAEANQPPQDVQAYFGDSDEFHMGFHFPLMPRIFMALKQGSATPIAEVVRETPQIPDDCQWCIFLRNHDELTLEMVTPEERDFLWSTYAPQSRMRLNLGIRRRLAPLLDNDRRRIELANSLLFTLPGSPIIYYGDEIGMGDDIWLDDRDGVRTPMQWSDEENAGFSAAPATQLYSPVISGYVFGVQGVNVRSQMADSGSLFHSVRRMIAVRKQHRCFGYGECELLEHDNEAVLVYLRKHGSEKALILNNLSPQRQTVRLHLPEFIGVVPSDLLSEHESYAPFSEALYALDLEPYQYRWLLISEQ